MDNKSTSVFSAYPLAIGFIAALRDARFCRSGDTIIAWRPHDSGAKYTGLFVGEVLTSHFRGFSIYVDLASNYASNQIIQKEQYFSNILGFYPIDRRIWSAFQIDFFESISDLEKQRCSQEKYPEIYPGLLFDYSSP